MIFINEYIGIIVLYNKYFNNTYYNLNYDLYDLPQFLQ